MILSPSPSLTINKIESESESQPNLTEATLHEDASRICLESLCEDEYYLDMHSSKIDYLEMHP